jgi:hypothetical protein
MASAKKIGIISLLVILLIGGGIFSFLYMGSYSTGTRSGTVTKISKKGYLFKTYEGQLNMTEMNIFSFSVDGSNEQVLADLKDVSTTGERVTLHYEEKFVQFSWRGDTKYFIVKVEKNAPK